MQRLKYFLILAQLLLLLNFDLSAQRARPAKDSVFVKGSIYNNHDQIKNAVINVYNRNDMIKRLELRSSNRFDVNLPINALITIEITAPNFHTKRFIFDTNLPSDIKEVPGYEFDMDVFSEEELSGVNTSLLDFPIGLVSYNQSKGKFLRNKDYTKKMKKRYLDLLEEAAMTERAAE